MKKKKIVRGAEDYEDPLPCASEQKKEKRDGIKRQGLVRYVQLYHPSTRLALAVRGKEPWTPVGPRLPTPGLTHGGPANVGFLPQTWAGAAPLRALEVGCDRLVKIERELEIMHV